MKLIITRPVVITGDDGVRSFVPGLAVEVDEPTAQQILAHQAGIAADPVANTDTAVETPTTPRRRKSADDQT